ncbi:hypothetical protein LEP1GSC087_3045 [Leptospira interrogans serovar Bataviae str. L1111]|nr:hypothetical protein LEP1GSC087_3045 [Leptospira interrogans serovar Bataviae str. L1111]EMN81465.1 hypothetical protein LEP1GSC106_2478 [Leptospira interrogans serovar Grippotyphosa str. UI 12764]
MASKQQFCEKIGWTMILLVFHSSHNFQSLINIPFMRVPTFIFLRKN